MSPVPAEHADKQQGGGGGGLVRNLLLPAFTDAGSNDTFVAEKQATSTTTTSPSVAEQRDVTADSVISEASTIIHDNRSKNQREQLGDTGSDKIKTSNNNSSSSRNNNYYRSASSSPDNMDGFNNNAERTRPPPFFASTRPPRSAAYASHAAAATTTTTTTNKNTDTSANETTRLVETPPPISLQDMFVSGGRSLSTVAMARGEGYISSSDGDLAAVENTILLDANKEPLTPLALEDDNGDVLDQKEKDNVNDSNEDDSSAEQPKETTEEALLQQLEKEETQQQQQQQDEPISKLQETIDKQKEQQQKSIIWEEEATPDQTAFGKQLIFQRQLRKEAPKNNDDRGEAAVSEVLSTASEMGTVIDMERLKELDEDAERMMAESPPSEQVLKNQHDDLNMPDLYRTRRGTATEVEREEKKCSDNDTSSPQRKRNKEDAGKDPHPIDFNEKAAAILTQAIRRIGSGLGGAGGGVSRTVGGTSSSSAPSTPRLGPHAGGYSHHDQQSGPFLTPGRNSTDDQQNHPSSFLLRSPGSAAFELASSAQKEKKKKSMLSPRFASRFSKNMEFHRSNVVDSRIDEERASEIQRALGHSRGGMAFQIARSCFSFDAYDTTMDDTCEVPFPDPQFRLPIKRRGQSSKSVRWPDGNQAEPSFPIIADDGPPVIRSSLSWDVGGSSQASPPFRPAPFRPNKFNPALFESPNRRPPQVDMMSDFSRTPRSDAMELKTPERIEIEREDALDILACLVERGVSLRQQDDRGAESRSPFVSDNGKKTAADEHTSPSVKSFVAELRTLIDDKDTAEGLDSENGHRHHLAVLDELVRSHEYAQEMRRASQSALSWLNSIGRSLKSTPGTEGEARLDLISRDSGDIPNEEQAAGEDASEGMNLLTAKAMLHSAQMELKEKSELAERLNEELAQCRAEIGRLKSAAQSTSFRSPNRSILDESDETSAGEEPGDEEGLERSFDDSSPIVGVDESGFLGSSFLEKHTPAEVSSSTTAYRAALEKANEQIRKLHEQLREKTDGNDEGSQDQEAPVVNIEEVEEEARITATESPSEKRERMVDIEVLDAENFVTEWTDLVPPLPPPPDHGLHSPIVEAVLEQWSNSPDLHTSLLDWMDQVLSGSDSNNVPPLTLSNLDHQVRDGFVTHILPLLLRRPDILVDVKTRVQRFTTYDLAVTVEPTEGQPLMPLHVRRHLETTSAQSDVGVGSTANSSATTALIANGVMAQKLSTTNGSAPNHLFATETGIRHHGSRLSYDEMAETGLGVGPPSGLMSTLGSTLGGLLTRRAGAGGNTPANSHKGISPVAVSEATSSSITPYETAQAANTTAAAAQALFAAESSTSSEQVEHHGGAAPVYLDEATNCDQPYHRVVSAPPGRIGVTFVEYRGHAMVSDVADDSPLSGWIFPSDIVIAIDEMPVSGMRVRDIIKILKDRAGRQRAMRVISSHAMNEFTLNSSALLVDGPS